MKDISVPSDLLETIYTRLQDHLDQQAPTMVALRLLLQSTEEDSPDELDKIERLEAKLSSQSDVVKALADTCNHYCAEIDQLKAENAELKANLCESLADSMMDVVKLKAEKEQLKLRLWDLEHSEVDHVLRERDTLRKQLDEARELLRKAAMHVRPTCSDLYADLHAWLETNK